MISAPRQAPKMVPRPPISEAPPITQAAMASSSLSVPASGDALPTLAVKINAAAPDKAPSRANTFSMLRLLLMPESRAASALPPMA